MNKNITIGDQFSALREAIARLENAAQSLSVAELISIDESAYPHVIALFHEYAHAHKSDTEFEEQLWQTLDSYLKNLNDAYTQQLHKISQENIELTEDALKYKIRTLGLIAQSHFLRYQSLPDNFWMELHKLYQLAEQLQNNNSCDPFYLQTLMMDTVNRTNMLRWEIALVSDWLQSWREKLVLASEYDETQHLFFVNLLEDKGARRMRGFEPTSSYRYWHVDKLTSELEGMQLQLKDNILPEGFNQKTTLPNAANLVEQLLAEWSSVDYQRQRRGEERAGVSKSAQVVHGVFNVCQHVKNLEFSGSLPSGPMDSDMEAGVEANNWVIENESTFGFGAVVKAKLNLWLKPGRLIALDYEFNPDLTVVGVVRSIQQQFEDDCYVGIEVFSHTPSYVRLTRLTNEDTESIQTEAISALYLPKDDERLQAATVVMPVFQYVPSGYYQLKLQQRTYRVQLGEEIEHKDDWLRATVEILTGN